MSKVSILIQRLSEISKDLNQHLDSLEPQVFDSICQVDQQEKLDFYSSISKIYSGKLVNLPLVTGCSNVARSSEVK